MSLKLITAPSVEPLTLNEAKIHLRIDTSPATTHPDDSLITGHIKAARKWCENFQRRTYVTQTWDLFLDCFPDTDHIDIPLPPLQSVSYVKYKDGSGTLQTLSSEYYIVDTNKEPGRIALAYGQSWPSTYGEIQDVQIRFVCGYGDAAADVPDEIKSAMYLKISDLYENRGDADMRSSIGDNNYERAAKSYLWQDRDLRV